ncbi:hypothetical protein ACFQ4C_18825 [Larkinella insperata]|uniref:Copper chaperone n=1 Tax=Larkinella insperata TaxID=332158 RepID=A0ABW3QKI3_9BACT|nr:hypothetical protein [Larkinella insperata]
MIEVFKTDVKDTRHAKQLIWQIQQSFADYSVNFDLEDCDKILRIRSETGLVQASDVITILHNSGFKAEVLPDD